MIEPFLARVRALFEPGSIDQPGRQDISTLGWNLHSAANSVRAAQIALARAKAEQQLDRKRLRQISASIEDLENRARNALLKGADALAREAAEAIAMMQDERQELEEATRSFDDDLSALTDQLHRAQSRLRALRRGERTATVREEILRTQSVSGAADQSAISRAEEQLTQIQLRQERDQIADREFAALAPAASADAIIEKLAEAGRGDPVRSQADDVLERLRAEIPLLIEQRS
ncbi:hypothetical protein FMN50_01600 [Rhodobacterales bacterium]|nr:hypothetical protein FMN50_01600 [Rhodobacterales bacterium]